MKKKIALMVTSLVLVVAMAVGGTLAYLTSTTGPVTNTFTVGNVTIDMDEAKVTEYGVKDGDTRVKANTYKMIPGHTYVKDPTITVADGSESCWLFAKVENQLGDDVAGLNIDGTKWTYMGDDVWGYNDIVGAGAKVAVFSEFTISAAVADLSEYNGKQIIVTACAVQSAGLTQGEALAQATFS